MPNLAFFNLEMYLTLYCLMVLIADQIGLTYTALPFRGKREDRGGNFQFLLVEFEKFLKIISFCAFIILPEAAVFKMENWIKKFGKFCADRRKPGNTGAFR